MFGTKYFQLLTDTGERVGEFIPTGDTSFERGTAMQRVANTERHSERAGGTSPIIGLLTQKVTEDGPSYEQKSLGILDLPEKVGSAVSMYAPKDGDRLEVEGEPSKGPDDAQSGLLVTDGTGAVASNTAIDTQMSVYKGRWRQAQSGDYVEGLLKRTGVTPEADASNIRVEIEIRKLGIKA